MQHRPSLLLASLFAASFAQPALADKGAAVLLFDEAERLMTAGKFADACPKYLASYRSDPQLGVLLHLADCQEQAGQTASAWASFRDAVELAEKSNDQRASIAKEAVAGLEKRLSRLKISVPTEARVAGLDVKRDGEQVPPALWSEGVPVDSGEHEVSVTAPGYKPWSTKVAVRGDAQLASLDVKPLEALPHEQTEPVTGTTPRGEEPVKVHTPDDPGATQRLVGWTVVGAGAVGLGVGLVFELQRSSKLSDRDAICPTQCDPRTAADDQARADQLTKEARTAGTIGLIGLVGGGILVGAGLAVVFTAPKGGDVTLAPAFGPGFAGMSAMGAW